MKDLLKAARKLRRRGYTDAYIGAGMMYFGAGLLSGDHHDPAAVRAMLKAYAETITDDQPTDNPFQPEDSQT